MLSKKMARLRHTARKSVPGGPYRVEGFRLPEQVVQVLSEQALSRKDGSNTDQRFKCCATIKCPYDIWIDKPLSSHAHEAIEELVWEKKKLHGFNMDKIDRLRMWEAAKQGAILMKLQEVENEMEREESDGEDAS
ncbi:hypothetical protein AgCh_016849 [Apium graveolens]